MSSIMNYRPARSSRWRTATVGVVAAVVGAPSAGWVAVPVRRQLNEGEVRVAACSRSWSKGRWITPPPPGLLTGAEVIAGASATVRDFWA